MAEIENVKSNAENETVVGDTEENIENSSEKRHGLRTLFSRITAWLYDILAGKKRTLIFFVLWSLFLDFILESSLRKSFLKGAFCFFEQPVVFLFNILIIFASFTVLLLVKRRMFGFLFVSALWIAMAITNTILMSFRPSPFNGSDFRVLLSAFEIVGSYVSLGELLLIVLVSSPIVLIVYAFVKGRKSPVDFHFAAVTVGIVLGFTVCCSLLHLTVAGKGKTSSLPESFRKNGYAFSFIASVIDSGIDKPDGYDDDLVKSVISHIDSGENSGITASQSKPNVVFLQLESFYDPSNVKGVKFSKDPMPIFRKLCEDNTSGKLRVPTIGGGTANTEFEVLTGMGIDHFGIAEYPYLSILQNATCESVAYNFKEHGYASHAIHNHTGTFYDRNIVFPNLGFDTYISIENMSPIVYNENGWAKDSMLVDEILGIMDYTVERADLVYAISVQPHGEYPGTKEEFELYYDEHNPAHITVYGNDESAEKYGFDYWVNQLYDVDLFIGDLIRAFEEYTEPVVLVMFGDHLPSFDVENWEFSDGNCYTTEYVIWSNFEMDAEPDCDLYTFQLAPFVTGLLGIEGGYMNKLHQRMLSEGEKFAEGSVYDEEMHILQYDMLYGEKYAYGGKGRYFPSNIRFGYKAVSIDDIAIHGDTLYVYGTGFNDRYSHIYINGSKKNTTYLKNGCVIADGVQLNEGDVIKVVQSSNDRFPMNESNKFVYSIK